MQFADDPKDKIIENYKRLIDACHRCKTKEERTKIERAFIFAYNAHLGIYQKSGVPFINHPIEVARITAGEIGLGTTSVIASLLHDVIKSSDHTIEDITNLFGEKIAGIVNGLTKLNQTVILQGSNQAENLRKLFFSLSYDIRVIFIKLAEQLHYLRTLENISEEKKKRISNETLYIYAPLAHRIGLYRLKTELEDLSFKYIHPTTYEEIKRKIAATERKHIHMINRFSMPISNRLLDAGFDFEIKSRPKSIYSCYKKMVNKNVTFEEVYDLLGIRIIFKPSLLEKEKEECWSIYGIITQLYKANPDRLRDWVSYPKKNGYEALHGTAMSKEGKWVEFQIRSERMEDIAERGYAAHWKYKGFNDKESPIDKWMKKIQISLENPDDNAIDFLEDIKLDSFSDEILIFTPKGEIKKIPVGSTVLDFAFLIHSQLAYKCIGAKINHKIVPINHQLQSGDQVEIITSDKQMPKDEWLNIVKTPRAKAKIKSALNYKRQKNIVKGIELLKNILEELKRKPNGHIIRKLTTEFNINHKDDLYFQIGSGILSEPQIIKALKKVSPKKIIKYWKLQLIKPSTNIITKTIKRTINEDLSKEKYVLAKCCNPTPGDEIIGYKNLKEKYIVHKTNCTNAIKLKITQKNKFFKIQWKSFKKKAFLVRLSIEGQDRLGVLNEITNIIAKNMEINIRSVHFESTDNYFHGIIDIYIFNNKDLEKLKNDLQTLKGIKKITQIKSEP